MAMTKLVTVGNTAERKLEVPCESCLETYSVTLRASGSYSGESRDRNDPALAAKARRIAEENLGQLEPMEACPRCGFLQGAMVERTFTLPVHAGMRRRYDECADTVNSPYARARRLHARKVSADAIREIVAVSDEVRETWDAIVMAFVTDETYNAIGGRQAALFASMTEGELLAYFLRRRLGLSAARAAGTLESLYGLPPESASALLHRLQLDGARRDGSAGLVAAGFVLVLAAALVAFVFGVAVPFVRRALNPPPPAEQELKLEFPTQRAWASPTGREDEGPRPVGSTGKRH